MEINNTVIQNASTNYLSLDELAFLYSSFFELKWEVNIIPASILKLRRMGYIDESNKVLAGGEAVLFSCIQETQIKPVQTQGTDKFDEIWMMFPRDDGYRHFTKTRMIRWNKAETKKEYLEALKKVPHEDMVKALRNEIEYRKNSSEKENFFKYMKSSINWFKTEHYNEFLDEETKVEVEYGKELS